MIRKYARNEQGMCQGRYMYIGQFDLLLIINKDRLERKIFRRISNSMNIGLPPNETSLTKSTNDITNIV